MNCPQIDCNFPESVCYSESVYNSLMTSSLQVFGVQFLRCLEWTMRTHGTFLVPDSMYIIHRIKFLVQIVMITNMRFTFFEYSTNCKFIVSTKAPTINSFPRILLRRQFK